MLRETAAEHVLGIDGCPGGGWVVAQLSRDGLLAITHAPNVAALRAAASGSVLALIDIPIGLVDGPRACDVEARQLIGVRRSSVFPAPPRWLLECETLQAADAAMAAHGRKRVQRQLWNIVARIREVDGLLRSGVLPAGRLRECHPELCFRTLYGGELEHSKHTREGLSLRREIIGAHLPGAAGAIDAALSARAPWNEDDVLDACIAAITGAGVWSNELATVPETPPRDACGLPMEMVVRWPREKPSRAAGLFGVRSPTMAAPDLPPPPPHIITERPLAVHLHVKLVSPESLAGSVVIVIDAIRASATICQAFASGAVSVLPTLSIDEAVGLRARLSGDGGPPILLGGERGGVMPPGFDLDNSPPRYTPERVGGKRLAFSTTNGTAALLHAGHAARVLVGSMLNVGAVCREVEHDPRPVHILCCGTRDEISQDDILPAGAMVERFLAAGRQIVSDDSARLALLAWRGAKAVGVEKAMGDSRGGRNLHRIGLAGDVEYCSRVDTLNVVPEFFPARGEIRVASAVHAG